jgi:excisionase family DNA binding protein
MTRGSSSSGEGARRTGVRQHRRGRRGSDMAVPETVDPDGQSANAIARLLATDMREDLPAIMREILERSAFAERLAYSPDEAAELLGISRELVHDLLRTGQLGSVKAGRRRLIAKHHLEAFLAGEP